MRTRLVRLRNAATSGLPALSAFSGIGIISGIIGHEDHEDTKTRRREENTHAWTSRLATLPASSGIRLVERHDRTQRPQRTQRTNSVSPRPSRPLRSRGRRRHAEEKFSKIPSWLLT